MKNNNTDRIRLLFERYASDKASLKEKAELFTWVRKSDDDELTNYLKEMMESGSPAEEYDQARWDRMLRKIMDTNKASVPFKTRRKIGVWTRVAAAFIGLSLTFASYWFLVRDTKLPGTEIADIAIRYQNDVPPGSNKAILTLDDHSTIILDKAHQGTLAQQGNTKVLKLSNGKLAYEKESNLPTEEVLYNTVSTPRGGQYEVILPDSSKVWLNAASSIRFPTTFTDKERRVEITGEAYFEVAKNTTMPFIVNANNKAKIKVLGTHFNINAYNNESTIKTTLLEGSVQVFSSSDHSVTLKPGQQAQLTKNNQLNIITDDGQATAWKDGFFFFKSVDIETIMRQVARWYDIEIAYTKGNGKSMPDTFTGKISRSVNLSQLLQILEKSEVHFMIEERKITVVR